jgi:hypothetical protein
MKIIRVCDLSVDVAIHIAIDTATEAPLDLRRQRRRRSLVSHRNVNHDIDP